MIVGRVITRGKGLLKGEISRRMAASMGILIVLTIVVIVSTAFLNYSIQGDFINAQNRSSIALRASQLSLGCFSIINLSQSYAYSALEQAGRSKLKEEILGHLAEVNELSDTIAEQIQNDPDSVVQFQLIKNDMLVFLTQSERVLSNYETKVALETQPGSDLDELANHNEVLAREISGFQTYELQKAEQVQTLARNKTTLNNIFLAIIGLGAISFSIFIVFETFRRIVFRLNALTNAVGELKAGQLGQTIGVSGNDEIGELGKAVAEMAHRLSQTLNGLENNILELRQTQEALVESEEHYRTLFAGIPLGMFRSTADGVFVDVNPALVRMFGYPDKPTLLETNFARLYMDPGDLDTMRSELEATGVVQHKLQRMQRYDGKEIWVRNNSRMVHDEHGNILYEGSLEDITELRAAERALKELNTQLEQRVRERTAELEAANKEMESFSYSVSHDLRSPLRSIDGYSKILLDEYAQHLDEEGQQFLNNVRRSAQRMAQLIDDLLLLSRVSRSAMSRSEVNLTALACEILEEQRQLEPDRIVRLSIDPNLRVSGDPNLLRIMLQNLLSNAWKFTRKKAEAHIEFINIYQDGKKVFCVRDNGAGFNMQYADKLFHAFQRLHHINEFEGTGIGLATVARIINRHGGRIWTHAVENEGAEFYFTLPD